MRNLPIEESRFTDFLDRLQGEEGCHFRVESGKYVWNCDGDRARSTGILERMGLDAKTIARVLAFCSTHGGYCDCEVILNVEDKFRKAKAAAARRRLRPNAALH